MAEHSAFPEIISDMQRAEITAALSEAVDTGMATPAAKP